MTSDLNQTHDLAIIKDFDACFYCLGVSASGMTEVQYSAINYDLTINIAKALQTNNPNMTFVYISGAGTDMCIISIHQISLKKIIIFECV